MTHFIGTKNLSLLKFAVCFIFCIAGVSACSDSNDLGPPEAEINYSVIHQGTNGSQSREKEFITLSTQQDYEAKLSEFRSEAPVNIDFSTQRVLLVSMGEQNSGGFNIEVTRIEKFGDGLVATAVLSSPGDNCAVTLALTNPYQFIQLTSQDDDIQVSEQNRVIDCP